MEQKFNDGKVSHKKCWEMVSKSLKDHAHSITGPQCAYKLRSLKKTYKSIKNHNNKSGNNRRTWHHFEVLKTIIILIF
ncbi:hypothetical protein ALC57_17725 [Trachymyrmex cornetzi]|uniref:Myb/SANT-like DNA-binding domain-containing protein n=1 Tax=Trachymyrmex cornetzi TaxID=471704 RepID=A0A151IT19_9HYME|nr:hypothetical protein ALC57_17725 [Trachymyrmex cornetzi]